MNGIIPKSDVNIFFFLYIKKQYYSLLQIESKQRVYTKKYACMYLISTGRVFHGISCIMHASTEAFPEFSFMLSLKERGPLLSFEISTFMRRTYIYIYEIPTNYARTYKNAHRTLTVLMEKIGLI